VEGCSEFNFFKRLKVVKGVGREKKKEVRGSRRGVIKFIRRLTCWLNVGGIRGIVVLEVSFKGVKKLKCESS
jgi:hypothetical protein